MPARKNGYSVVRTTGKNGKTYCLVKVSIRKPGGKTSSISLGSCGVLPDSTEEQIREKAAEIYGKWRKSRSPDSATVTFRSRDDVSEDSVLLGSYYIRHILSLMGIPAKLKRLKGEKGGKYRFDLAHVTEVLAVSQILSPGSKRHAYLSPDLPGFGEDVTLSDVYRALDVLSKHADEICAYSYKQVKRLEKRKTRLYFYDCTNFVYTQGSEGELLGEKKSKEGIFAPLVQLGLLIDEWGFLVGMNVFNGKKSEQPSLKEQLGRISPHLSMSDVVVCTDAGLCSSDNRQLLSEDGRGYITTQPILGTKVPAKVKEWVMNDSGFTDANGRTSSVREIKDAYTKAVSENRTAEAESLLSAAVYKDAWFRMDTKKGKDGKTVYTYGDLVAGPGEELKGEKAVYTRLLVSFQTKYWLSQTEELRKKREKIAEYAAGKARFEEVPKELRGFATFDMVTEQGEVAEYRSIAADEKAFGEAENLAGLYVQATNLGDGPKELYWISRMRWQVEMCFREMKTNLRSRPIYLTTDDHIRGHFVIIFLALQAMKLLMYRMYAAEGNKDEKLGRAENTAVTPDAVYGELRRLVGRRHTADDGFSFVEGGKKNERNMLMAKALGLSLTKQMMSEKRLEEFARGEKTEKKEK